MADGVVSFDYATWVARYPEFVGVAEPLATLYFTEAGLYLNNTPTSVVCDLDRRALLLNMLTAHIAALNAADASSLVGRISSATEGSVSVSAEYNVPGTAAWFAQTKYGAAFWQATVAKRAFRYVPPPAPRCAPWPR